MLWYIIYPPLMETTQPANNAQAASSVNGLGSLLLSMDRSADERQKLVRAVKSLEEENARLRIKLDKLEAKYENIKAKSD